MFVRNRLDEFLHPWLYHRAPDDDGGSDGGASGGDDDGDDGDGDDGGETNRTYSQTDMDRIRRRETKKADAAARRKVLEELGVTDAAEAAKIIKSAKEKADKDRSEQERLRDKATAAETSANEAKAIAAAARLERDIDRALVKAAVDPKRLDRIAKLVTSELGDDPDADDIQSAIDSVRDDFPEAFAASDGDGDDGGKRRAPSGEGKGGTPPKGQRGGGKEDPMTRGADRARARQGRTTVNA